MDLLLFMYRVCHAFFVHCSLVFTCWGRTCLFDLLFVMFLLCFCHFPVLRPGSCVVLDCIDS